MQLARASGQRRRKHVGLQRPERAVAGHVAHVQWQLHRGNADEIGHRQAVFCL